MWRSAAVEPPRKSGSDNDDSNLMVGSVGKHVIDFVAMRIVDVQTARTPVDMTVVLTRRSDDWRIDDWEHELDVLVQQSIEESLIAILECDEVDISLEISGISSEVREIALELFLKGGNVWRKQPEQSEASSFGFRKGTTLIKKCVIQEHLAAE